jgi:plastocyanin
MKTNTFLGAALITALAVTALACGQRGLSSPTGPSLASARSEADTQRSRTPGAARRIDADGDGYEDPDSGMPADPATVPMPNPDQIPLPEGVPAPAPVQLTINVVGLLGPLSFVPNPLQAAVGNLIVWTNNDLVQHDIVLDDGTPVGNLAPGQSSAPITLITETTNFHCTLHPSMTGQITPPPPPGEVLPGDPSQSPMPDPYASPSPEPYGDGYDDGYDDDYYY